MTSFATIGIAAGAIALIGYGAQPAAAQQATAKMSVGITITGSPTVNKLPKRAPNPGTGTRTPPKGSWFTTIDPKTGAVSYHAWR